MEIGGLAYGTVRQPIWSAQLHNEVLQSMQDTMNVYSTNSTARAMWNEIQLEVATAISI